MTTAKAITNGYFPFGAVMISDKVADVFEKDETGRATIMHGYTYSCHPVGAAAAIACLAETKRLNVPVNAAARGTQLFHGFQALQAKYDIIGDVRGGHGLMTGMEIVSDRENKTPMDKGIVAKIGQIAYENGAMVRVSGSNILCSPPLILTSDDVATIVGALDAGFAAI